jgi:AmmeMemoRadiSam system protein B/AmmeMemoRadiSam system protein A
MTARLSSAFDIESDIAGSWYPSEKKTLLAKIAKMWDASAPEIKTGNICALIVPHAGYQYSGECAAKAFKTLKKKYDTVIIIGASHRYAMKDTISVPLFDSYTTPLGKTAIAKEKVEQLLNASKIFRDIPDALANEHSVQIEVPLLQYALKDAKIVLIITGQLSKDKMKEAGEKIAQVWDEKTLLVVSTDFTHYGERFGYTPFDAAKNLPEKISTLDMGAFAFIQKNDPEGFYNYIRETGATICGAAPLNILLYASGAGFKTELIEYTDSSKVTGDDSDRVSYVSAVVLDPKTLFQPDADKIQEISDEDRKTLLSLARKTIEYALTNGKIPDIKDLGVEISENLKSKKAVFVTLTMDGHLRGCVGEIFATQALYRSVIQNAVKAAFNDSRFPQLQKNEMAKIHIEISVLTEPKEIESYEKIKLGRDGIILSKDGDKALFLPQVAPEQGWTIEETLEHLSIKAGFPADAWKKNCAFKTFQAEVFEEE